MDWIKKNPAQLSLAIAALILLGVSVKFLLDAQSFPEKFVAADAAPNKSRKILEVDKGPVEEAKKHIANPNLWTNRIHSGLLFTSEKYFVENGKLVKLTQGSHPDYLTQRPIPFSWFEQYGLPVTDEAVVGDDADGDGFLNADEWRESIEPPNNKETDPTKKESHPPYYKRLWLKQFVKVPFRLKFQTYNGDVKNPASLDFQINTLDVRSPSEFLKIGETIARIFKIEKFEFKEVLNEAIGEKVDVSELTLVNTETNDPVVLILNKVVDSPNKFGRFEYFWGKKLGQQPQVFDVPILKDFVLQPQVDQRYKLKSVTEEEAVIVLPSGQEITIKRYPPPPAKR
jgi:hypothetical protein